MKTVLILVAIGQVGQALLKLALQHPDIARVVAPTRRPLAPHANLDNPLVDFEALPENASLVESRSRALRVGNYATSSEIEGWLLPRRSRLCSDRSQIGAACRNVDLRFRLFLERGCFISLVLS